MTREEVLQWLETELPPMLREDPMFRAQVIGLLSEALVTKAEFTQMLVSYEPCALNPNDNSIRFMHNLVPTINASTRLISTWPLTISTWKSYGLGSLKSPSVLELSVGAGPRVSSMGLIESRRSSPVETFTCEISARRSLR